MFSSSTFTVRFMSDLNRDKKVALSSLQYSFFWQRSEFCAKNDFLVYNKEYTYYKPTLLFFRFKLYADGSKMQNDPVLTASDLDNIKSESPQKYIVVSEKSVTTYESDQTAGSKRSTEEEELRSLSTTPRYSHEDLGEN